MAKFAMYYDYDDQRAAERLEVREGHRAWLRRLDAGGHLLAAGAFADGAGAMLALEYDSLSDAISDVDQDPYFSAGLVRNRALHEWNVGWGVLA